MASYKELIRFIWQSMRLQKWSFALIFLLDAFTWPLDVLIWPYILHLVIDIFADYETNRLAAGTALKNPIIAGLCLVVAIEISSRIVDSI